MSVYFTEKAAGEIKRILTESNAPEDQMVRVGAAGGGCSGLVYKLHFDNSFDPSKDLVSDQFGVKVVVDKKSDLHLDGLKIDYVDDGLDRRGFSFDNPNAQKSCGCGHSFSA